MKIKNIRLLAFKIIMLSTTLFLFIGAGSPKKSVKIIKNSNQLYLPNTVVIKLKSTSAGVLQKSQNILSELNLNFGQFKFTSAKRIFSNDSQSDPTGLNRIMQINYGTDENPYKVASKLKQLSNVEWAEPKFVRRLFDTLYIPNDPKINEQYFLQKDHMYEAWNVTKGDTSVVIGIVDTGVDWPHPDLYANIWHNWSDIKTNWATDTDGIKYDSIGWDFGGTGDGMGNPTPDSNPIEDKPEHGTLVAGVASAVTDNGIGVAGIGFKSKIMPVKVAEGDYVDAYGRSLIVYGFEGIKYAADNGAKVINCSWGGGGYSQAEQDVINYAISKGALVVVAAGNDNTDIKEYPAAYSGVLCVAATNSNDVRSTFSNYGSYIDVCAPVENVFSTFQPDTLAPGDGTSFSAPQVSGLAALVFAKFPNYTPLQVAEQIRVNCDNIDSLNTGYEYMLGSGRINAYKALTDTNSISVRAVNIQPTDAVPGGNGDENFEPGETVGIKIVFTNYLNPVNNLNVTLQSMSPYATVVNNSFGKNYIGTLDSTNNDASLFTIQLSSSVPTDEKLLLRLNYSANGYSDFQLFEISVNPSYLTQAKNNIAVTINGTGNFGFNDYPTNVQGEGFKFQSGNNLLFEGALMMGTSPTLIEDEARGSDQNYKDTSFYTLQPFAFRKNNSDVEQGVAVFNDQNAGSSKLGITTKLETYSYSAAPDNNYVILKYNFINDGAAAISNFYAGIFCDWDLIDGQDDNAAYDSQDNFGYVYHNNFNTWVATALISSTDYGFWAIMNDGSDSSSLGGFSIYDGFSFAEKWKALSDKIGKTSAGPGDISEVTSAGPYNIQPRDTVTVAFALAAGASLSDLRNSVQSARAKYQQIITSVVNNGDIVPLTFNLQQNYPNPFNPATVIKYQIPKSGYVSLKIYDILGREITTLVNEQKTQGDYKVIFNAASLPSGVYFYKLKTAENTAVKKMILLK